ncbi:receptor-type tyrosine-protein phosphatase S-like [Pteropus alecto]|uniref:Receptor-type tyrosine-protein phosphatase S n=1 Tax=Pteropus alecto TaxID=9402 RepID=L5JR84_PTEAL|nr:receptor-type tyrosine-protein phosphatase S-like [Pteropus alecto]ELK01427.1 Receptor-type tyrosine-protein phosphatase S [Pteropus alecto]
MLSHPPVPIADMAEHTERLKANDSLKLSQEYESIDPGQQFTWEHSNLEVNKPKNRYANVIAYDHSRVILQPIEGSTPAPAPSRPSAFSRQRRTPHPRASVHRLGDTQGNRSLVLVSGLVWLQSEAAGNF